MKTKPAKQGGFAADIEVALFAASPAQSAPRPGLVEAASSPEKIFWGDCVNACRCAFAMAGGGQFT
jgi:hypothetical protein